MLQDFYPRPPRGGRRSSTSACAFARVKFLSTPSARRATRNAALCDHPCHISIHALREEGDQRARLLDCGEERISIHALREEGDHRAAHPGLSREEISIHALREEGDAIMLETCGCPVEFLSTPSARRATATGETGWRASSNFYPRPPRGGRRVAASFGCSPSSNFYPRPPRGGRPVES